MIRSGLVNQRRGGGFENGYTHQRDNTPRDEVIRPYVDGFDTGFGTPTPKQIIPKPVAYSKIFSKRVTPDERLYLLKLVQKGVSQMDSSRAQGRPNLESVPLPKSGTGSIPTESKIPTPNGQTPVEKTPVEQTPVEQTPVEQTPVADELPGYEEGNFWTDPPTYFEGDAPPLYTEEMEAVDVVSGPVHQPTFKEEEKDLNEWIDADFDRRFRTLLPEKHDHSGNDVTPPTNFDTRFKALMPKRNGFEKQGKFVDIEYPDFKTVYGETRMVDGVKMTLEQQENLGAKLLESGTKVGNLLNELASSSEGSYLNEGERARIKMAVKMLTAYEGLTPFERGRFNDTLTVGEYNTLIDVLSFIESKGDAYEVDTSLFEAIVEITQDLPVVYPKRGFISDIPTIPGGYPVQKEVKKEIKINGVGPRSRTVVRKRGLPAPVDTIKKYLGPRYSQRPGPKGRRDWVGESVRRMKRNATNADVPMAVDVPPRNRNPLGLTVDTSITKIDKKAPKVRKRKVNSKMPIPDVEKKNTLRKRK